MSILFTKSRATHVAGRDIHIHQADGRGATAPPADAVEVLICPQCGQRTWRHSRHCMHCLLDLWLWRAGSLLASAAAFAPLVGYLAIRVVASARIDRRPRLD